MQAYCKTCERMIDIEGAKTIRRHGSSSLIIASDGLAHTVNLSGPKVKSSKRSPKSAEQLEDTNESST